MPTNIHLFIQESNDNAMNEIVVNVFITTHVHDIYISLNFFAVKCCLKKTIPLDLTHSQGQRQWQQDDSNNKATF